MGRRAPAASRVDDDEARNSSGAARRSFSLVRVRLPFVAYENRASGRRPVTQNEAAACQFKGALHTTPRLLWGKTNQSTQARPL